MTDPVEAPCANCFEKETGEPHPAHKGRCGMPTGHLGVVSCYCRKYVPATPEPVDDGMTWGGRLDPATPEHRRSPKQDYDPTPCCLLCFKPWPCPDATPEPVENALAALASPSEEP